MDLSIHPISPAEIPILLDLIGELARFEKLEHEVEATVGSLEDSFFGASPIAGAFLGRCDGEVAGYAVYYFTFSSFLGRAGIWLEDLYVRPPFQKRGLGGQLINAVARVGAGRNCGRFEWTALHWNQRALDFYQRLGARPMDEWRLLRMDANNLRDLAAGGKRKE
jgi:GNAT superfamily N-acetyltransferase